jgi:DNA-binding protein HU-beta
LSVQQGINMNKAQLIEMLASKTKTSKLQSEAIFEAALEIIQKQVSRGDDVKIVGFGTFSSVIRKPRIGRNPKTGESVEIPKQKVPRFKPGKEFKTRLN